ncbi:MAG TPA: ThiF family adenylyltransferase [Anaeromyxobacteraceae bacterium]|nr:ThiF family adenylyltransferase [Anaeromyxobacteraceae bacterium]
MALTDAEVARYARQLILPGLGEAGQERLRAARVRVVGGGPATGPAIAYLAEAGIGTLLIDDPDPVGAGDGVGFLYHSTDIGRPRGVAAAEAVRAATGLVQAELPRPGARPTGVLVSAGSPEVSRAVADEARLLGLPHVVAEVDGQGGAVTVVPPGAPCYACAVRPGIGADPTPAGAATVGALAALELVLLLAGAASEPGGRRIEVFRGAPLTRASVRQPGCACGASKASPP